MRNLLLLVLGLGLVGCSLSSTEEPSEAPAAEEAAMEEEAAAEEAAMMEEAGEENAMMEEEAAE